MTEREFEEFDNVAGSSTAADVEEDSREDSQLIDEIVSMGQNPGLEMDSGDVEELLDKHRNELTTEELQHFQEEQKRTLIGLLMRMREGRMPLLRISKKFVQNGMISKILWNSTFQIKPQAVERFICLTTLLSATFVKFLNGGRSKLR